MTVRRASLLAALLPLGLLASTASASDVFTPVTPKTDVYLQCNGTTKENFSNQVLGASLPSWSTQAPASVTTGAGCGKLDDGFFSGADFQTAFQLGFGGSYTGNLDTLTVNLYSASVSPSRPTLSPVELEVRMTVDGISMFGVEQKTGATGTAFSIPAGRVVRVTPVATGGTSTVTRYTFSVTGLDLLLEKDQGDHDIQFDIAADTVPAEAWLWGAAEAPTGATLNPAAAEKAALKANKRSVREADLDLQ